MPARRLYSEAQNIPGADELRSELWISAVGHYRASNHVQDPRIREDFLLVCCIRGKGTYRIGECVFQVGGGDFFVCFPGLVHAYLSDPADGWEIRWVHFAGARAQELVRLAGFQLSQPVMNVGRKRDMEQCYIRMQRMLSRHREESALDATAVLYQLLLSLRHQTRSRRMEDLGIENALIGEPTSVTEMAAACSLSRSHFTRRFRRATGVSPWRYIVVRRIMQAKDLLSNTDLSVKEVSVRVGVDDPNYFSRLFQRETGTTPTEFRSRRVRRLAR